MTGTQEILISGFGGQGALFAGKFLAYAGLLQGLEVSWLPSYGPEMRGGTATCSVILSDHPIGSPIIVHPTALIAMNLPSVDKFEDAVAPGGLLIYDSTIVERPIRRTDIRVCAVPATALAEAAGVKTLANMLLVGKLLSETELCSPELTEQVLAKIVSARKMDLLDANRRALDEGRAFGA